MADFVHALVFPIGMDELYNKSKEFLPRKY